MGFDVGILGFNEILCCLLPGFCGRIRQWLQSFVRRVRYPGLNFGAYGGSYIFSHFSSRSGSCQCFQAAQHSPRPSSHIPHGAFPHSTAYV
jgi:hypothetical protein